jgi:hypothetical protein
MTLKELRQKYGEENVSDQSRGYRTIKKGNKCGIYSHHVERMITGFDFDHDSPHPYNIVHQRGESGQALQLPKRMVSMPTRMLMKMNFVSCLILYMMAQLISMEDREQSPILTTRPVLYKKATQNLKPSFHMNINILSLMVKVWLFADLMIIKWDCLHQHSNQCFLRK